MRVYCVRKYVGSESLEYTIGVFSTFEKAWEDGVVELGRSLGVELLSAKAEIEERLEASSEGYLVVQNEESDDFCDIIVEELDKPTYFD